MFKEFLETELRKISKEETENTLGNRANYIGASDVAGCLFSSYLGKKNTIEHSLEKLLIFERGHIAERIIEKALKSKGLNYFSQYEIVDEVLSVPVKAHLDFVIETKKEIVVLETKTTNRTLEMPYSSWVLQIQFQMGLLKKTTNKNVRGYIIALDLNSGSLMEFPVEFDENLFSIAINKAEKLAEAMLTDEAPEPEEQLYCSSCPFKGQCPLFSEIKEEIENDEILFSIEKLKELEAQKKEIEAHIKVIKADLEAFFKEKGLNKAKVGEFVVSISSDSSYVTIDTTKIKKDRPDLYEELIQTFGKTITRKGSIKIK